MYAKGTTSMGMPCGNYPCMMESGTVDAEQVEELTVVPKIVEFLR